MKIAILGSSGFIGTAFKRHYQDHTIIALARDLSNFEECDVVLNLAGESLFGRWSEEKLKRIRESRLEATRHLVERIGKMQRAPSLYIGASAIGYYGSQGDAILTEDSPSGHSYLATLCQQWEALSLPLEKRGVRRVIVRFGLVLGSGGGILAKVKTSFQWGLGAQLGSGKEWMSWIALDDLLKALRFLIEREELSGVFNLTSLHPVTNREWTERVAEVLHRPQFLTLPAKTIAFFTGRAKELFLSSTRVLPKRLLQAGFQFDLPHLEDALKNYLLINRSD